MSGTSGFYEMKGDVGMSCHEKRNKMHTIHQDRKSFITPSLHLCFFQYHNLLYPRVGGRRVINPRRACAARVTSVCVCVSVKSHLTYGASVRPENAVTYSAGNEGQNICGVFSETTPLQRSSTPSIVRPCVQSAIFPAESTDACAL